MPKNFSLKNFTFKCLFLLLKGKKKKTLIIVHSCVLSHFSNAWLFVTLWAVACQAPLSMGFSRQECWSGLPCPPPGDLPDPRIEPSSFMSPALTDGFFTTRATWEALIVNPLTLNFFFFGKFLEDYDDLLLYIYPVQVFQHFLWYLESTLLLRKNLA